MERKLMSSALLVLLAVLKCCCQEFKDGKMSFQTPDMTEEEQHSQHVPQNLVCDACSVVAYQLTKSLLKAEAKYNGKALKESEYLDIFEETCKSTTFENYGIKSINGVNRLSGEGLEAADTPGLLQGGGKWPGRIAGKCATIVGDLGEDELYAEYRKGKSLEDFLCTEYSKDCVSKDGKIEL